MKYKKILIILINCLCLWLAVKVFFDYYTQSYLKQTENPIQCVIAEKDCKYSKATSHCNVIFKGKDYRVPIVDCDHLNIGNNNTNFYYDKKFDRVIYAGYVEKKYLVFMIIMFIVVFYFTVKNWKKIPD
jgi:hypothetical protein